MPPATLMTGHRAPPTRSKYHHQGASFHASPVEPSTRSGRRFARPAEGIEVVGVERLTGGEVIIAATREARAILCPAEEVNFLSGPGKGVILIKLSGADDRVLGFVASTGGPSALTKIVSQIDPNLDAAYVVAQHMPASFTGAFADRMNRFSELDVREALDGEIGRAHV